MRMTFEALQDRLNEIAEELLESATEANADVFGLDRRAGYNLWLTEEQDAIVVAKNNDRGLQYYGGFEYVDKEFRLELGDYVLYSADDPRVAEHIAIAIDALEPEEPTPTPEDVAASKADLINDAIKCGDR